VLAEGAVTEGPSSALAVAVARQPIVDRTGAVVGFELLYRPTSPDTPRPGGEQMTAQVVLGALTIGLDQLVGDKTVFCNAERGVLVGDTPVTLPSARTVIEILETVVADDEAIEGCRDLVGQGFALALDDFVWREGAERLLELASIVKIDFRTSSREEVAALAARCRAYDVLLLAEKVETDDDVEWARAQGFDLFQGYAIERPHIVHGRTIGASSVTQLQLALMLLTEEVELEDIEAILRREPGLVVQVLQMASIGAYGGVRHPVQTVREALVLLGSTRLRKWIALTMLSEHAAGSVDGLAISLVRARTSELLARQRETCDPDLAFTAGMLSALDLLLGLPADQLADTLDLADDLKAAAFRHEGDAGALVAEVAAYQDSLRDPRTMAQPSADLDGAAAAAFAWALPYVSLLSTPG
jgi:EAL and modified HD-GYP domain-containing signal transduction protein